MGLSLARPSLAGFRVGPARAAMLGAVLTVAAGLLSMAEVGRLLQFLSMPVLTIVSLMVITLIAESAGLFRLLAWSLAVAAKGDGRRLFGYLFLAGTVTGALFTNDAAVLIFTPLVFRLVEEVQEDGWHSSQKTAYYFAVLYVANLVGPLVISNPINLVVSSWFDIGFAEYARWMVLPAVTSMVVTYIGIRIYFRRSIPARYRVPEAVAAAIPRTPFMYICVAALALTLAGFFTERVTGLATAFVAAIGAGVLLVLYRVVAGGSVPGVVRRVGWDAIAFVVGIFLVVNGLRAVGFTDTLGRVVEGSMAYGPELSHYATGFLASICSAVMNNHPAADSMALAIHDLPISDLDAHMHAYAALIGGDLGPKMLPIGSLAALLWFRILRERGVEISYWL
ncbi:MAG: SLC13 family permease, partial [Planctomycetota bacterium]|nr:SLC13 family permease [Planctomycetota bacterium]